MSWLPAATRYHGMTYPRCGRSGLRLPAISFGLWHNFGGTSAFEAGRAMVRRAFDLGITHFDLANNYGPPPGSAEEGFVRGRSSGPTSRLTSWLRSTVTRWMPGSTSGSDRAGPEPFSAHSCAPCASLGNGQAP